MTYTCDKTSLVTKHPTLGELAYKILPLTSKFACMPQATCTYREDCRKLSACMHSRVIKPADIMHESIPCDHSADLQAQLGCGLASLSNNAGLFLVSISNTCKCGTVVQEFHYALMQSLLLLEALANPCSSPAEKGQGNPSLSQTAKGA